MNKLRDFSSEATDYFSVVSKNEKDLMNTTKNLVQRMRLNREVSFTEDFRKRFMTKEYGNYEKYDKNTVEEHVDKGEDDSGLDSFEKNFVALQKRMDAPEKEALEE